MCCDFWDVEGLELRSPPEVAQFLGGVRLSTGSDIEVLTETLMDTTRDPDKYRNSRAMTSQLSYAYDGVMEMLLAFNYSV